jgi:hypothetical protein
VKRLLIAATVLAALVAAPSAAAKACVRIQAPATAEAGQPVRVVVRVYLPTWNAGRVVKLKPLTNWSPRLKVTASGPKGERRLLAAKGSRDGVGVVTTTFAVEGEWQLNVLGWEYAPKSCAPTRTVRVV